jgi:superfamily II DNA or RNA helicase
MLLNPRVFFEGPAGTGKTMLAIESARRGKAENRHLLFLCFNRLLGLWLRNQTTALSPDVNVGTLHRHMLEVANLEPPAHTNNNFWEKELPERAIEQLLKENTDRYMFDELILDETQDLLRPQYMDFLDLSLKGGLAAGRWRCFGDLERQTIYGVEQDISRLAQERFGNAPHYSLRACLKNQI